MPALNWHIQRGRDELPELMAALGRMGEPPHDVLEVGAREFERILEESYPPVQFPRPRQEFVSNKQRRAVMAMIRRGEITIPYERTGKLGRGWDVAAEALNRWHVRNLASYSVYVQGGRQSRYMRLLGWRKVGEVYKQNAGRVRAAMRRAIVHKWSKRSL